MKILLSCLLAASATVCFAQSAPSPAPAPTAEKSSIVPNPQDIEPGTALRKHIYIMDNVSQVDKSSVVNYGFGIASGSAATETVHGAPILMAEFQKKCPSAVLTINVKLAEYLLIPQSGSSQLLRVGDGKRKGDIVYVSPARKVKNLVKDVCKYMDTH